MKKQDVVTECYKAIELENTGLEIDWKTNCCKIAEIHEKFKKNLSSYLKTHFDVVQSITDCLDNNLEYDNFTNAVSIRQYQQGSGGMYELAKEWTDEFTEKYKEEVWGKTLEYYDTLEIFLTDKNNV